MPPADRPPDELISELYQAHALGLVRMARLLLRNQQAAEDVVQDVFLNLHPALPRLRDRGQMLPCLQACMTNGCRSAMRRHLRGLRRPVLHEPAADSAESAAILTEQRREVLGAVARLPRPGGAGAPLLPGPDHCRDRRDARGQRGHRSVHRVARWPR